jgi:DNA repair exonuclease SbcCD ATPase subunit
MLSGEKDATALLLREKQQLEATVKSLQVQKEAIAKQVALESAAFKDVDLKRAEEVRRELFELREAYESKVWECADLEDSVNLLEEEIEQTTRKLDTLAKAKAQADALDSALAATAEVTQARQTQMQQLEQLKAQLVRDIQDARRMLAEENLSRAAMKDELTRKKEWQRKRLQARNGLENFLLEMDQEMHQLRRSLLQEQKARQALEANFEVEMIEMNRRLLLETQASEKWQQRLQDASRLRSQVQGDIDLMKAKLDALLEDRTKPAPPAELKALLSTIETELGAMNEILDQGLPTPEVITRQLRDHQQKFDAQAKANASQEARIAQLEKQLQELLAAGAGNAKSASKQ